MPDKLQDLQDQMNRIESMLGELLKRQGIDPVKPRQAPVLPGSFRHRFNQAVAETEAREDKKKQKQLRQ